MPILYEPESTVKLARQMEGGFFTTDMYFWNNLIALMEKGYSPLIAVVGKQRIGKSHIALVIAYKLSQIYGWNFEVTDTVYFDPEKLLGELKEEEAKKAKIMDEAINLIHRKEWYQKSHILMSKVISTQAYLNICHIWCAPFRSDLDASFEKYFDFMIHVIDRGHIKIWQFVKRHDAVKGKEVYRMFLDDVEVNLGSIPQKHWEEYVKLSMNEKERMMKQYAKKKNQEMTDERRIRLLLSGAAEKMTKGMFNNG